MPRYFMEVAYKGTAYSGFQVQENAITVQSRIEEAFCTIQRCILKRLPAAKDKESTEGREWSGLTGSSRTDAGVHALQNYFHFDYRDELHPSLAYKLNAILPYDIAVRAIVPVVAEKHARFDALSREYEYRLHKVKNPFLKETSYLYPYPLYMDMLKETAALIKEQTAFWAFSKTNTQVSNFNCSIYKSEWTVTEAGLTYTIAGNRFLRGMVRLLTATQLKVGQGQMTASAFRQLFNSGEKAGYSVPARGLFLKAVNYPENFFSIP